MRNTKLWKKTTAILMCAAMLTGLCACSKGAETGNSETVADSNGAKTEQAAESEDEVITLTVMGEVGNDCISTDDAIGRKIKEELGIVLECTMVTNDKLKVMAAGGDVYKRQPGSGLAMLSHRIRYSGACKAHYLCEDLPLLCGKCQMRTPGSPGENSERIPG